MRERLSVGASLRARDALQAVRGKPAARANPSEVRISTCTSRVRRSHLRGPESCVVASRSSGSSFLGRRSRRRSESCDESESDPDPDEPLLRPIGSQAGPPRQREQPDSKW